MKLAILATLFLSILGFVYYNYSKKSNEKTRNISPTLARQGSKSFASRQKKDDSRMRKTRFELPHSLRFRKLSTLLCQNKDRSSPLFRKQNRAGFIIF